MFIFWKVGIVIDLFEEKSGILIFQNKNDGQRYFENENESCDVNFWTSYEMLLFEHLCLVFCIDEIHFAF